MKVVYKDNSIVKLALSVVKVKEFDYSIKHEVHVENRFGKEVYYFEVVKPTPVWMIVLIILGCLLLVGAISAIGIVICKVESGEWKCCRRKRGFSQPEPSTSDTK